MHLPNLKPPVWLNLSNLTWLLPTSCAMAILLTSNQPAAAGDCFFTSVVGVNFGPYDVFSYTPLDSTGSLVYRCTNLGSTPITIDLSRGNSPSYASRTMIQGGHVLSYNLYLDAARTIIWGDGTDNTSRYGPTIPPDNTDITLYIYGRIPDHQNAFVGSYTDTVTITITF